MTDIEELKRLHAAVVGDITLHELAFWMADNASSIIETIESQSAEIARLKAELEEARRDAERYRFLREKAERSGREGGWYGYYTFLPVPGWDDTPYSINRGEGFHHKTLDEAIDAARQQQG